MGTDYSYQGPRPSEDTDDPKVEPSLNPGPETNTSPVSDEPTIQKVVYPFVSDLALLRRFS